MHVRSNKGIIHIGFGVLLLILIVIYIFIYFSSPSTAEGIRNALSGLVTAVAR